MAFKTNILTLNGIGLASGRICGLQSQGLFKTIKSPNFAWLQANERKGYCVLSCMLSHTKCFTWNSKILAIFFEEQWSLTLCVVRESNLFFIFLRTQTYVNFKIEPMNLSWNKNASFTKNVSQNLQTKSLVIDDKWTLGEVSHCLLVYLIDIWRFKTRFTSCNFSKRSCNLKAKLADSSMLTWERETTLNVLV